MTDKEGTINGVECIIGFKPNPADYRRCSLGGKDDNCDKINDCFIKQLLEKLQAKEQECETLVCQLDFEVQKKECLEQECEELKEEIDDLKEIIQRHDNDNNALLSEFEDDLVDYYRRYKECLTEIKEIAENMNNECFYSDFDCKYCDMKNGCTYHRKIKILQKISEYEVENAR